MATITITIPSTLTTHDADFLQAVAWTIHEARGRYPGGEHRHVAFTAEAGEAAHAVQKILTGRGSAGELQAELIQTAAMAARLAVEGDAGLGIPGLGVSR